MHEFILIPREMTHFNNFPFRYERRDGYYDEPWVQWFRLIQTAYLIYSIALWGSGNYGFLRVFKYRRTKIPQNLTLQKIARV